MSKKDLRKAVRENYAKVAKQESSCCAPKKSCCGDAVTSTKISEKIGYTIEELKTIPDGADLGLGCGNPVAFAQMQKGDVVMDIGSGAGIDCFLAANKVGENGKVIGVDMTPEMLDKARENAKKGKYDNVEFRLGEIEHIPAGDNTVDIIISNCVINLSTEMQQVFHEAFRVLKPGGKLMVSDIVLKDKLPDFIKESIDGYVACLSGASLKAEYLAMISKAGFTNIKVLQEDKFTLDCFISDPAIRQITKNLDISQDEIHRIEKSIVSAKVYSEKPSES